MILLGIVVAAGVLAADLFLPLGVAAGVGHFSLVLITLWLPGALSTYIAAVAGSALNIVGFAASSPGGVEWMVAVNRGLALIVIWSSAAVVLQRKRVQEEIVRASRRLGERIIRAAPNFIYIADLSSRRPTFANPEVLRLLDCPSEADLARFDPAQWSVHPDDAAAVSTELERCAALGDDETSSIACRIIRPKGEMRWYFARHVVFSRDSNGSVQEILGVAEDVTEREAAREALSRSEAEMRRLATRLISIQEEERKRVAREIHDNISQQMAAIAIEMSRLRQAPPRTEDGLRERLGAVGREVAAVSDELHGLSHQLHPSVLENLGLEAALEAECNAFSRREGVATSFQAGRIPEALPPEAALCLYRIAQESLRNVAQHADASKAEVSLRLDEDAIVLSVGDDGRGFATNEAASRGGVGLTSMQERARLAGASLSIRSSPGAGTEIRVSAPLFGEEE